MEARGMLRRLAAGSVILLAAAGVTLAAWSLQAAPGSNLRPDSRTATVDVELVLAVDISYSMDMDELALQREGYAKALTSREFLNALKQGIHGKVAVTYFEWAGATEQKVIVPWRVIDGPESAGSVAPAHSK
jgi:hypothetical protein